MTDTVNETPSADDIPFIDPNRTQPIIRDTPEYADVWIRTPYNADDYGPVEDWANDFDHADPAYNPKAPEVPLTTCGVIAELCRLVCCCKCR